MQFIVSNNINDIGYSMATRKEELLKFKDKSEDLANLIARAYEAARMIFEKFPEFKQIIFDTVTDEEREMVEKSTKNETKN